jgi:hypothetical protein
MVFSVSYEIELECEIELDPYAECWEMEATKIFSEHFPYFYYRHGCDLKFEPDESLDNGIEFSPWTWFDGLDEAFEFLDDFYEEYNNQDVFYFSDTTGLHINLSNGTKKPKFNFIKGLLFLNEDYALKDYPERVGNRHSRPIKKEFNKLLKKDLSNKGCNYLHSLLKSIKEDNAKLAESYLNDLIKKVLTKHNKDDLGFNLNKAEEGYVEFRYPGGLVSQEQIINSTLYYSKLVELMLNKELDQKRYFKKLTSLLIQARE